jgi:hypothetical protein
LGYPPFRVYAGAAPIVFATLAGSKKFGLAIRLVCSKHIGLNGLAKKNLFGVLHLISIKIIFIA